MTKPPLEGFFFHVPFVGSFVSKQVYEQVALNAPYLVAPNSRYRVKSLLGGRLYFIRLRR